MRLKPFKLKHLVSAFHHFMSSNTKIVFSPLLTNIFLVLNFLQLLSYLIKLNPPDSFEDPKMKIFSKFLFYMNFSNLLSIYSSSTSLSLVFFIISQVIIYYTLFFWLMATMIVKYGKENIFKKNIFRVVGIIFQIICSLFDVFLMLPILELFSKIIDNCNWYSILQMSKCEDKSFINDLMAIIGMAVTGILGIIILILNKSYFFLDKDLLKMKFTFYNFVIFLIEIMMICLWLFFKKYEIIIYVFLCAIGFIKFYNFLKIFPYHNTSLNKVFISFTFILISITAVFFLKGFTDLFNSLDLFYSIFILIILSIKLASRTFDYLHKNFKIEDFTKFKHLSYNLEDFYQILNPQTNEDKFILDGIFNLHHRNHNFKGYILSEKKYNSFMKMEVEEREKIVTSLISEIFLISIQNQIKKDIKNKVKYDTVFLKYCTFLTYFNKNPIKANFEIQNIIVLNKNKNFYFKCIISDLLKKLAESIQYYENSNREKDVHDEKELDVRTFFNILKEKERLRLDTIELLNKKIKFFENYKEGIVSYEQIIKNINDLIFPIRKMKDILNAKLSTNNKIDQKKIFVLKFKIIFFSMIMNNVNEGLKVEDELEKLKKKEFTLDQNLLNCNCFFDGNIIPIRSSFQSLEGNILPSSKTKKVADFFKYSLDDLKQIDKITNLMPPAIAINHKFFVHNFISKGRSKENKRKTFFNSFALDKQGYIFPIKIYIGFCYEINTNFVMQSALLDLKHRTDCILILNEEGKFEGISEGLYNLFKAENFNIAVNDLYLFNMFCLIPVLKNQLQKTGLIENKFMHTANNLSGKLCLPLNIGEILDLLHLKLNEEEEIKSHNSYLLKSYHTQKSSKTIQSGKSLSEVKNSKFMSKLFKTLGTSTNAEEKSKIENKFKNNNLSNYDILVQLIDLSKTKKYLINYNLSYLEFETSKNNYLKLISLSINSITNHQATLYETKETNEDFEQHEENNRNAPVNDYNIAESDIRSINLPVFEKGENLLLKDQNLLIVDIPKQMVSTLNNEPESAKLEQNTFKKKKNNGNNNFFDKSATNAPEKQKIIFSKISESEQGSEQKSIDSENDKKEEKASLSPLKSSKFHQHVQNRNEQNKFKILETEEEDILKTKVSNNLLTTEADEISKVNRNLRNREDFRYCDDKLGAELLGDQVMNQSNLRNSFKKKIDYTKSEKEEHSRIKKLTLSTPHQVLNVNENSSQHSSSTSAKKTFTVFNIIKLIQSNLPLNVKQYAISEFISIIIILVFCSLIFSLSIQYIDNYYRPLQIGTKQVTLIFNGYCLSSLLSVRYEFRKENLSTVFTDSVYTNVFDTIFTTSYFNIKETSSDIRSELNVFDYQKYFKESIISCTDPNAAILIQKLTLVKKYIFQNLK